MNCIFYQTTHFGMLYQDNSKLFINLGVWLVFGLTIILDPRMTVNFHGKVITNLSQANFIDDIEHSRQCQSWEQVNTNGFGLPSEFNKSGKPIPQTSPYPYLNEEGFEVLVFNDQLYLGMEADNTLGARLWRTRRGVIFPKSQLDWEEVSVINGYPFGVTDLSQADHIDSLAMFKGWIYTSTANRGGNPEGTLIFRSPSGNTGTWEDALELIGPGFGKPQNENFKDIQVFNGHLCGGTWNERDGAEVWCTFDGENWEQKNISGFGEPSNMIIWSGHVFDGKLYFGLQNVGDPQDETDDDGRLFRTASLAGVPIWEEVFRTRTGTSWGNILGDLSGFLYISIPSNEGMLVYRSSSGDPGSWEVASLPGFENNPNNKAVLADGATLYNGDLFVGVTNGQEKFSIWRSVGIPTESSTLDIWEQIPATGMEDPSNIFVQLISFKSALYAWTSNPVSGQQVWRTICGTNMH